MTSLPGRRSSARARPRGGPAFARSMTSLPASIIDTTGDTSAPRGPRHVGTTGSTMTGLPGVDHRRGHGRGGGSGACQVERIEARGEIPTPAPRGNPTGSNANPG